MVSPRRASLPALAVMLATISACSGSPPLPTAKDATPAGLKAAAIDWSNAFLTGPAASIYAMEGSECRPSSRLSPFMTGVYLRGERSLMERYAGEPLTSIHITGVRVRNVTNTSGEAEVQYALPKAKVGNDNWVSYFYEGGQWKVSNCHAPIGGESQKSSSSTPGRVALTVAAATATPSHGLTDGQVVTVAVRGFVPGIKFFVSECLTPIDANKAGCGPQLAVQPFGVTDEAGNGSTAFTVRSEAAPGPVSNNLTPCAGECVIVAVPDLANPPFVLAPISFANS